MAAILILHIGRPSLPRQSAEASRAPLALVAFFTLFIVLLDALVVAPIFEKSYAMFSSPVGTWLLLLSIFVATYLTGVWFGGPRRQIPTAL
jgi:hypothetical protein